MNQVRFREYDKTPDGDNLDTYTMQIRGEDRRQSDRRTQKSMDDIAILAGGKVIVDLKTQLKQLLDENRDLRHQLAAKK